MRYIDAKMQIGNIKDVIAAEVTHFLNDREEYELPLNFKSGNREYDNAYIEEDVLYVGGRETDPCEGLISEFGEKAIEMPVEDAAFMLKIIESKQIKKK